MSTTEGEHVKSRTFSELMQEPAYRRLFATPPRMPANMTAARAGTAPYVVWISAAPKRWRRTEAATYKDAYSLLRRLIAEGQPVAEGEPKLPWHDLVISNKRFMCPPSADLTWRPGEGWCSRCRRPVVFARFTRHHALTADVYAAGLSPDELRCPYCGIRQAAMKTYSREA